MQTNLLIFKLKSVLSNMNKCIIPLTVVASLGLSSCYFNSAGHLFGKAGYKAQAKSEDAKPGQYVYTDGSKYYVDLPRYRVGKPIKTQYSVGEKDKRTEEIRATGDTDVFEIPADFAMYLTGQRQTPTTPSSMTKVDGSVITSTATTKLPIVLPGGSSSVDYKYSSGAAAWWYTAGIFDWLCIDLPITCVENSLVIGGAACLGVGALLFDSGSKSSNGSGSSSDSSDSTPTPSAYLAEIKARADQRGYITVDESSLARRCIRQMHSEAQSKMDDANRLYSSAQNSNYALMSPVERSLVASPSTRMRNARSMASEAQSIEDDADSWEDWLDSMGAAGRIR